MTTKRSTVLAAGIAALACGFILDASGQRLGRDVGPNNHALYEKQCGGCHFPHQPGWLPERSWRALMGSLAGHFGKSVSVAPVEHSEILGYLVGGAADRHASVRAVKVSASIDPSETPRSISQVPYVAGIHGGFLDPAFRPRPQVKTLADCSACHGRASAGDFRAVAYAVSDASFRGAPEPGHADVLSVAERLVLRGAK